VAVESCFVDTSAWFDWFVPASKWNKQVNATLIDRRKWLYSSDFVLDELLTLLRARGWNSKARNAWELFHDADNVELLHLTALDVDESYAIFEKFSDKQWSFTDCTSYWLIQKHNIPFACATDEHFRQFGNVSVLPHSSTH
jgi:predicted nucleic acid-binding protein